MILRQVLPIPRQLRHLRYLRIHPGVQGIRVATLLRRLRQLSPQTFPMTNLRAQSNALSARLRVYGEPARPGVFNVPEGYGPRPFAAALSRNLTLGGRKPRGHN